MDLMSAKAFEAYEKANPDFRRPFEPEEVWRRRTGAARNAETRRRERNKRKARKRRGL